MQVAIVQFGNGELSTDRIVSDAHVVSPFSDDIDKVKDKLKELKWAKGFTNMAQAFLKANQLISRSKRKTALGTMLLITDGKPSFKFQTHKAVKELKGRAKVSIVQVKSHPEEDTVDLMKSYATQP